MDKLKAYDFEGKCPFCGYGFEASTCVTSPGKKPHDGDLTMCLQCGEWAVLAVRTPGKLRKPTDAEYEMIAAEPLMADTRAAWAAGKAAVERDKTEPINDFPPFDTDFEVAIKQFTSGDPDEHEREAVRLFFDLGALCVILRTKHIKGDKADFFFALTKWENELRKRVNQYAAVEDDERERA